MVLNVVWLGLFFIACFTGLVRWGTGEDPEVFNAMVTATFETAKSAFEIALGLTGILTLWLGLMKVGEKSGAVGLLAKVVSPVFKRIFPGLSADHPAAGSMVLNFSANMLGLDNAATPVGLKAMKELQASNPDKDTASDHQIMFLVLNASSLTLIPVSIMAYRAQLGAANPADVFLPILFATYFSTLFGFLSVAVIQKIKLFDPILFGFLISATAAVIGGTWWLNQMPQEEMARISTSIGNISLFAVIIWFLALAAIRKVNAWEAFIEGAKEGFQVAITIIPFLVGILVAVAVFRASGAMDSLVEGIWTLIIQPLGLSKDIIGALPTMLMKPLSGGGARGMMVDAMKTYGPDSFTGRLACTFQGAADTTLYILAVYFGSVGVRKTRYALPCALFADVAGFAAAIVAALIFFT